MRSTTSLAMQTIIVYCGGHYLQSAHCLRLKCDGLLEFCHLALTARNDSSFRHRFSKHGDGDDDGDGDGNCSGDE